MQKILIIEDDPAIREELSLLLKNEGYSPLAITDFSDTDIPALAAQYAPDLILLDINLPGRDGFSLCANLQKSTCAPIIFVTSRDSGLDEVRALSLGGDDYITKPYSIPVLLARIKTVLRRTGKTPAPSDVMEYGGLELNLTKGTVSVKTDIKTEPKVETETKTGTKSETKSTVELESRTTAKTKSKTAVRTESRTTVRAENKTTARTEAETTAKTVTETKNKIKSEFQPQSAILTRNELQILACLMSHAGEIVSRADLIEALWDNQIYIDDNTLSVNVTRLRGKLAQLGFSDFIKTRRGMGYQLETEEQL